MSGSKRRADECDTASDWEEGKAKKRSRPSNGSYMYKLQGDRHNYGTAASQRPRRESTRQMPVCTAVPRNANLKQGKATSKPKQKHVTTKARTAAQEARKQITNSKAQSQLELDALSTKAKAKATEKGSFIVRLKITLNRALKPNPSRRSARHRKGTEPEGRHALEPVPPKTHDAKPNSQDTKIALQQERQDQCCQLQAPVPEPSQAVLPNASQTEILSQEQTTSWVPQTPGASPISTSRNVPRAAFETPQRVSSQDAQRSFTPPTPDSMPHPVSGTASTEPLKFNTPSPTAIAAFQSAPEIDNEATAQDGGAEGYASVISISEQQLSTIAEQLFAHRKSDSTKPEPSGQPEVWADGRQELCETLHYYRAYQGACYSTGGFVRGFMFDKVAHVRDYIDTNVVISRAGGGLTKDKDSGEMRAGRDQVEDVVAHGLRNCMSHYNPVAIITGVDNLHIPSKPPHQYCVMDYFKPTHIWVEKSGGGKIVRYRFEKLNTSKDSWWRPKDTTDCVELGSLPPPVEQACETCGSTSPQIYLNSWMCLQPACTFFWNIIASGRTEPYEPDEASLIYDPRFLKQKTPWHNDDHEYPLVSNSPELSRHSIPGEDTSQAFWLGIVCPDCGRCNSRLGWIGWECQNPTCGFKKTPPHSLIPAVSLREPLWPLTSSYTLSRDTQSPLIDVRVSFVYGYRINRYSLPGIDGFITHMIANKTVLEEPGGPDTMFEELQQTDIGLRRRSMPNGQLKGPNYCRHFAVNYGMPYKFIAATASQPFSGAARPITATRSRLNWAAKLLLAQDPNHTTAEIEETWKAKEFNEVLALGYFEQQKINYHDDGEYGLGPTIATLSLGAPGTMRIRMKARHYHGVSPAGVYDDAPPLPGCQQYDARLALQPSLDALKTADSKAYTARRKQIPKDLKLRSAGQAKDVLTMQLGHGDIVIMHGAELQRYYEHAVEHAGQLRFALTCRYIDPGSFKEGDKPDYEVGPDVEGYDGARLG